MKIDPNKLEQLDKTAQGIISDAVNAVNPVAGKVLDWKISKYNKAQYPDKAPTKDKEMVEETGPLKMPKIPAYLMPLAPINPLYKNPAMQQAARDASNGYHDEADDHGSKTAPSQSTLDKANKLAAIAASESRAKAVSVGAKPKEFFDPLTVGIVAGNIALASGAAWAAGKVGDYIGDKIVGADDKPKKATEAAQSYADSTTDILPAIATLGALGVATYAGSKAIGAGYDWLTKKKKQPQQKGNAIMEQSSAADAEQPAAAGERSPYYMSPADNPARSPYYQHSEAMQQSRAKALPVGAQPKEFFDPLNAAIAAGIALPVAYAAGKATDWVYDTVTGKKQKEEAA